MYRPPENSNRVKSIRSKFENKNDVANTSTASVNGCGGSSSKKQQENTFKTDIGKQIVSRQLSDPNKRNIKRTPAFRLDRLDKKYEVKSALRNCDIKNDSDSELKNNNTKPLLVKSKSSHNFEYIRNKFDKNDQRSGNNKEPVKIDLYTEPIPKCLRVKKNDNISNQNENNANDLNLDIYNCNTLKISDKPHDVGLSDTLKAALQRPLPEGPAPKKPPRTFFHTPEKNDENKNNTINVQLIEKPMSGKTKKRHDPKYMLNRLENALKNNKLKPKPKLDISTSGEDSDDSLLFKSKTSTNQKFNNNNNKDKIKCSFSDNELSDSFTFNCLNALACTSSPYAKVNESNSTFFLSSKEEPIYAEPYNNNSVVAKEKPTTTQRNSLYYMSTCLLSEGENHHNTMNMNLKDDTTLKPNKQISDENSSLSSFTSDLDSATSTPLEENKTLENSIKIKELKDYFENDTKKNTTTTNNRIEDLKCTLQKTLDHSMFGESVDIIIGKFENYVKTMPKYRTTNNIDKKNSLFHCLLIVEWNNKLGANIKFKYPIKVQIPHKIEDLCYPEAASGPLDRSNNAQCYSLVITNDKGERTFGYCRRVLPEGSNNCLPLAYCILSKYRAPRFYKKILIELESRHGIPDKLRDKLIGLFYNNKFPQSGESIKIDLSSIHHLPIANNGDFTSYIKVKSGEYGSLNKTNSNNKKMIKETKKSNSTPNILETSNNNKEVILTLHHDSRYEDADLKPLHKLPKNILLKIFASLLLERKVILISCVISKLSCCVDALQSILYPFSWPHTFIPILPQCLWDVVESPTPVICGILSVAVVNEYKIENAIVVDLDEGSILIEEGDEDKILSGSMQKIWLKGMSLANSVSPGEYVHSVYLSDAYIQVFISCLRNYKTFIHDGVFQKEAFIKSGKTRGIRRFLEWFTHTTMFIHFIDSVIKDPDSFTLFDQKIKIYGSEESSLIIDKLLEWKK